MIRTLTGVSQDVAITWALTASVLVGGLAAASHWFDATQSTLAAAAEISTLQIAANEKILRTKPKLLFDEQTIGALLSNIDLEDDAPSTVANFLRELDRASRTRAVRLVSVLSGGAASDLGTTTRAPSAIATTMPSGLRSPAIPHEISAEFFDLLPLEVVLEGRFANVISLMRSLASDRILIKTEIRSIVRASSQPSDRPRLSTRLNITLYHRALALHPTGGVHNAAP